MSCLSDEELIARCACGDRHAMDMLVAAYHGSLIDFAFRHLGDRETSADIAQMTFVRVMQSAASFRRQSSVPTWLYSIALNLVRDEYRRRGRRKESLASELGDAEMPEAESALSAEEAAIAQAEYSTVWSAVGELDDNKRTAIILRYRHDLTYEEIAEVMGERIGTVKSWIHYALKTLRQSLEPMRCED